MSTWWHTYSMDKKNTTSCPNLLTMIFKVCGKKEPPVFEDLTYRCVSTENPLLCCYVSSFEDQWLSEWYIFFIWFFSVTLYEEDAFTFVSDLLHFVKYYVHLILLFSVLETPWCSPIKVKHGYANCRTPQGEYYKNVLGTRCDIRCQKGYELHGPQQLICQSSKRWSGKVLCKRK